ncbi:helitron_like_N domain-containing protein [Nephila pilipes]|uniref:Helitron_like_N domain-containing protein n=1 Tax=Nephila pilipes TaxID=299642 RepID=A0A8X6UGB8_NEPPI|nr:helitron_like_N domain-containing protein [Nephila pilipes]
MLERYNSSTINEVVVVVAGDARSATRDIVICAQSLTLSRFAHMHRFYDALQYPITFRKGQEGYNFDIRQIDPITGYLILNMKISCIDYYAFRIMVRRYDFKLLLRCKQLLN